MLAEWRHERIRSRPPAAAPPAARCGASSTTATPREEHVMTALDMRLQLDRLIVERTPPSSTASTPTTTT